MYEMVSIDGSKRFVFQRPDSDINNALKEFYSAFTDVINNQTKKSRSLFLKELYNLILLCEYPTKNYDIIESVKLNNSFHGLEYYFHFSTKRISKTNELKEATPQLFESPEYYFTFLNGIKISIRHLLIQDKSQKTKVSPKTIAYALKFYKKARNPSESDKELYEQFSAKYGSTWESIKNEFSSINREKENSIFHTIHKQHIKNAIKLLADRKSKDVGREFEKNLNT